MAGQTYDAKVVRRSAHHDVRNVKYRVNEWGPTDARPLVLLHGWGDVGASFQFVVDAFSTERRIIAPDWRGFGESRCTTSSYWFPDYLADLDRLLAIYSPQEPVVLVGHSMGGNVASLYAGVFPERVAGLINVEGIGLADSAADNAPENYRRWIDRGRQAQGYRTYASFSALAQRIRERSPRMSTAMAEWVAREWAEVGDDQQVHIKADSAHKLPNPVLYRRAEAEACWRQVQAPVLLIAGADSEFQRFEMLWRDFTQLPFPEQRFLAIENAGHMVHFEQPGLLANAIEDFLQNSV